jgi:thiamine biosynthesis lipoprotein
MSTAFRWPAFAWLLLATALLAGCDRREYLTQDYLTLEGPTMGTYYRVTTSCTGAEAEDLGGLLEAELIEVNGEMSTYLEDSELSRFNRGPIGERIPVSEPLTTVLGAAARISERTGGAFDVTVGPLVDLWGFGPPGAIDVRPPPEAVRAARDRVGFGHLRIRDAPPAIRRDQDVQVDLSAIAKGHGVDRLAAVLDAAGCRDYLVDIGGEVLGRGINPTGQPWRIGIEVPDPERFGAVQRIVPLDNRAVATSGDYRNFIDLEDGRVSHTVDPRTGEPVTHRLASVSVIGPTAMWADGMATALNVLGPEEGLQLAEADGIPALFVVRRASSFEERYTSDMQRLLETAQ